MDAKVRRDNIKKLLGVQPGPISASRLAEEMGVSRQVIVGDIALLRAEGCNIIATARGYRIAPAYSVGRYLGKIPCQHTLSQTRLELESIVRMGGEVMDVVVDHHLYGEIAGQLNITTLEDVEDFILRVQLGGFRLLSELTGGVHLHTVGCRDKNAFDAIAARLDELGLLYRGTSA